MAIDIQLAVFLPRNKSQPLTGIHQAISDRHWPFCEHLPMFSLDLCLWLIVRRKPWAMTGVILEATIAAAPPREISKLIWTCQPGDTGVSSGEETSFLPRAESHRRLGTPCRTRRCSGDCHIRTAHLLSRLQCFVLPRQEWGWSAHQHFTSYPQRCTLAIKWSVWLVRKPALPELHRQSPASLLRCR